MSAPIDSTKESNPSIDAGEVVVEKPAEKRKKRTKEEIEQEKVQNTLKYFVT